MSPVPITMGSSEIAFGGSAESIDHIKGNTGEGWHVVISIPEENVLKNVHKTTLRIGLVGAIFLISSSIVALFLGKLIAKPIVSLAHDASKIGAVNLRTRTNVSSTDEIGILAKSINSMAGNLETNAAAKEEIIEAYIGRHSEAHFSHSICLACYNKQIEGMEND